MWANASEQAKQHWSVRVFRRGERLFFVRGGVDCTSCLASTVIIGDQTSDRLGAGGRKVTFLLQWATSFGVERDEKEACVCAPKLDTNARELLLPLICSQSLACDSFWVCGRIYNSGRSTSMGIKRELHFFCLVVEVRIFPVKKVCVENLWVVEKSGLNEDMAIAVTLSTFCCGHRFDRFSQVLESRVVPSMHTMISLTSFWW